MRGAARSGTDAPCPLWRCAPQGVPIRSRSRNPRGDRPTIAHRPPRSDPRSNVRPRKTDPRRGDPPTVQHRVSTSHSCAPDGKCCAHNPGGRVRSAAHPYPPRCPTAAKRSCLFPENHGTRLPVPRQRVRTPSTLSRDRREAPTLASPARAQIARSGPVKERQCGISSDGGDGRIAAVVSAHALQSPPPGRCRATGRRYASGIACRSGSGGSCWGEPVGCRTDRRRCCEHDHGQEDRDRDTTCRDDVHSFGRLPGHRQCAGCRARPRRDL